MKTASFILVFFMTTCAVAAPDFSVLHGSIDSQPAQEMMRRYLDNIASAQLEKRREAYEAVKDEAGARAYSETLRQRMVTQLGGFPERTPLNTRVVGQGEGDGFRYEKLIFESRPNLFVTAVLFLPLGNPPYPGVIVPCGHSENGKASEAYQRACVILARNGIAALIYDPIGQGERHYYLKEDGTPEFGSTLQHTVMGVGAILTGTSLATHRIWDGMRAIDCLAERPDIDPQRIGCTGNSGGAP